MENQNSQDKELTKDEQEFIEEIEKRIKKIEKEGLDYDIKMPTSSEEFKKMVEL